MDSKTKNRLALVTGGGHGVGEAIALALARNGFDVAVCGRTEGSLDHVRSNIESIGRKALALYADITVLKDVQRLFGSIALEYSALDVLVNNVGRVEKFGRFEDLSDDDWLRSLDLNFMSAVRVTREALPLLRKSRSGRIVNIASVPARQPGFFNPHYGASKAALVNLSKHLANVLAKDKILVNTICPGTLQGGGWDKNVADRAMRLKISRPEAEEGMLAEERTKVPLGEIGTPEDVAELVAFLASDRAKFITGTCIDVDGGVTRSIF